MAFDTTSDPTPLTDQSGTGDPSMQAGSDPLLPPPDKTDPLAEQNDVKNLMTQYETARKQDGQYRTQVAIDRRYAAGTADLSWAVSVNIIGSFIDILCAMLYARDPDVSVSKSEQIDEVGTGELDDFARTIQIVVSDLWRKGKLKRMMRKDVRAALSTGEGWLKVLMVADKVPMPQTEKALNDARECISRLQAVKDQIAEGDASPDDTDALLAEQERLAADCEIKLKRALKKGLAIDIVPTESFQCSLDIRSTDDHLDADWNANEMFVATSDAKSRFPRLNDSEIKSAKTYYQRPLKENASADQMEQITPLGSLTPESAEQYVSDGAAGREGVPFIKVIEIWDRRDGYIKTIVEGVKKWAVEPYPPPYPTTRFYPYFRLAFFEIDNARHPQSLAWRLRKLQDEYSVSRSNFRLARERSLPGVIVNGAGLPDEQVKKLTAASVQEVIVLLGIDPGTPIANLFSEKPTGRFDPRIYDNQPILQDMERIVGVQEALQSVVSQPKTATEANIQQTGTAARTAADRDAEELMLADLAQYTTQLALGALTTQDVQRIAGMKAFWPEGMDVWDLETMISIDIEAGSTGKPRNQGDREAWGVIMPLIKETILEQQQAYATNNPGLAEALEELLKETMRRMGDTSDPSRFLPPPPPLPPMIPGAPPPGEGADPKAPPGASAPPSPPPGVDGGAGAAPPTPPPPGV